MRRRVKVVFCVCMCVCVSRSQVQPLLNVVTGWTAILSANRAMALHSVDNVSVSTGYCPTVSLHSRMRTECTPVENLQCSQGKTNSAHRWAKGVQSFWYIATWNVRSMLVKQLQPEHNMTPFVLPPHGGLRDRLMAARQKEGRCVYLSLPMHIGWQSPPILSLRVTIATVNIIWRHFW